MARSLFLLGLIKSGSTLLNRVMKPITESAGFIFDSPANDLRQQGVELRDAALSFEAENRAYGGFRNLPWPLPAFAADRAVFLVRDPRDALTSLYFSVAYSHRPPGTGVSDALLRRFEARRARAKAQAIDDFVLAEAPRQAETIAETLRHLPAGSRTYRYEEVIFEKLAWVADMMAFLRLEVPQRRVAQIVQRQDIKPEAEAPHEHVRRVTPGDHREKLSSDTIRRLDEILRPVMESLGYAPSS